MERKSLDGLPTIVADTESLRQQLRELHASVKAQNAQRQDQGVSIDKAGRTVAFCAAGCHNS